jgi:hypothetical protein
MKFLEESYKSGHQTDLKMYLLLLGNDLAGDKVVVNPIVTDKPVLGEVYDPIIEHVLDLYPAGAVTRAMAQKAIKTLSPEEDTS